MEIEEYRARCAGRDAGPGWDAITARLDQIYGGREPDAHYGTVVKAMLGGEDPLDGVSIYDRTGEPRPHLHYVSYGMSELYYNEEAVGGEVSGWGFEFTFRLVERPGVMAAPQHGGALFVASLMQNLARYVIGSGRWFEPGHYITAKGPLKEGADTELTALAFVLDPELGRIDTPHGPVEFLQGVGLTTSEYEAVASGARTLDSVLDALRSEDPLLATDLARKSAA